MGVLREYFLNTSIHGPHFIADGRYHWTERFFWTICVLASWIGSLFLMITALEEYKHQKISFSVDTTYLGWKTNFPSIFVCEFGNEAIEDKLRETYGSDCLVAVKNVIFYKGIADSKTASDKCHFQQYFSEIESRWKSSCANLMTYCKYNNDEFPCCDEFLKVRTYFGLCYGFNTLITNKYASRESLPFKIDRNSNHPYGNLSFELKHEHVTIVGAAHNSVMSQLSVQLFSSEKYSTNLTVKDLFVSVKETFTEEESRILDVEHRGCRFQDENNLNHTSIYSLDACNNECLSQLHQQVCKCKMHRMPGIPLEDECGFTGMQCLSSEAMSRLITTQKCVCDSSCADSEVDLIGSTSTAATKKDEKLYFSNAASDLAVNIIVQPPTIRYTRQVVKTPLRLLVSVGGTVGLFIGASLLSIVEILYYFFIRPFGNYYLKTKNNKGLPPNYQQYKPIIVKKESRRNSENMRKMKNVKSLHHTN